MRGTAWSRKPRVAGVALVLTAALFDVVRAESPNKHTPQDSGDQAKAFFSQYAAAVRAGNADELATLLHPEALQQFRALAIVLANSKRAGPETRAVLGVDPADIETLSSTEICSRIMRWLFRHPEAGAALRGAVLSYVGAVPEGTESHIVYRAKFDDDAGALSIVDVLTVKRDQHAWKALLTVNFQQMLAVLAEQLEE